MGFLDHDLKGKKDIFLKDITSIQIKKPGLTVGYIQFSLPRGIESTGGVFDVVKDENTLTFHGKNKYESVLKIKEYIEKKSVSSESSGSDFTDEIEKLHHLMEKGIITQEEFTHKKKKLLGI